MSLHSEGIEWKIMYTINETTGEEYYFNLYEKWWHYFLLGFAYFIPHRAYKLKTYPKSRVAIAKGSTRDRKANSWSAGTVVSSSLTVGIVRIIQDAFILDKPEEYVWLYAIVLYLSQVLMTVVFYTLMHSEDTNYSKCIYLKIRIKLFSFKTLKSMIWHIIGIVLLVMILFEIWYMETNILALLAMVGGNLILFILMITFGIRVKHENENGELFEFGPII